MQIMLFTYFVYQKLGMRHNEYFRRGIVPSLQVNYESNLNSGRNRQKGKEMQSVAYFLYKH